MYENETPAAQGTEAAPENAEQQTQAPQHQEAEQTVPLARVNELTAKLRAAERQAAEEVARRERQLAEREAQIAALIQATTAQAQAYQRPPEPEPDIEPELKRVFDRYLTPLQRQQQQMQQQFAAQIAQFKAEQEFNQVAGNYDPEIQQAAKQLMQTWQANNYSGWKPVDALTYAAGQKAIATMQQASASQAQSQQFNQLQNTVVRNQAAPPAPAPKSKGLPQNFESLSRQQQQDALDAMDDFPI